MWQMFIHSPIILDMTRMQAARETVLPVPGSTMGLSLWQGLILLV